MFGAGDEILSVSVFDYGAVADASKTVDGTVSGASLSTLDSASKLFTSAAVGKTISIQSCGSTTTNQPLVTTIASYVSPTQVTLATPCARAVRGQGVIWGTDNMTAFQNWTSALGGKKGLIPRGYYLINARGNSKTINLPSNATVQMDPGGTLYYVGVTINGGGTANPSLFTIPGSRSNIQITGLNVTGEWLNTSFGQGAYQGYGYGSAIGYPNDTGGNSNISVTHSSFQNLFGISEKDLNNNDTNITFDDNTVKDTADTGANINTANSSISHNHFENTSGAIEAAAARSKIDYNVAIGTGSNAAIAVGGYTSGHPYTGSEVIGNQIIDPTSKAECIAVVDGFTYGTIANNTCQGTNSIGILGIANSYIGYVATGNNKITGNTIKGTGIAGIYISGSNNNLLSGNCAVGGLVLNYSTGNQSIANIWIGSAHDIAANNHSSVTTSDQNAHGNVYADGTSLITKLNTKPYPATPSSRDDLQGCEKTSK